MWQVVHRYAAIRAHPDKYEKDFDAIVAYLSWYIDKQWPTLTIKVESVAQARPTKKQKISSAYGTFKGKIELKKYAREEYGSMLTDQKQQLYDFQYSFRFLMCKKIQETS